MRRVTVHNSINTTIAIVETIHLSKILFIILYYKRLKEER